MRITIDDINRRYRLRESNISKNINTNLSEPRLFTNKGVFCTNNAINAISKWRSFDEDSNNAFEKALDIFELVCENCNSSIISTETSFLNEEVDRVKDASFLKRSLKMRLAHLNKKSATKTNKLLDKANTSIINSIDNLNRSLNKNDVLSSLPSGVSESFDTLINTAAKAESCDRIIETYNSISKRFNIDNISTSTNDSLYENAIKITKLIDTYNCNIANKYNAALETVYYVFNKNHLLFDNESIIEAVTDYFIFSGSVNSDNISEFKFIKDNSVIFESSEFGILDRITCVDEETSLLENELTKNIKGNIKNIKKDIIKGKNKLNKAAKDGIAESNEKYAEKMLDQFRKECIKDKENDKLNPSKLKSIITRIYAKSPSEIAEEVPNVFSIIRAFFIINAAFIHPICGIISLITDQCIKLTLERNQLNKIIKAYKSEIVKIDKKINSSKDKLVKDNLTKYKKELEKDLNKIEMYEQDIYTDEENDKKYDERNKEDEKSGYSNVKSSSSSDDDDFDWDDDDDDWDDFDESCIHDLASIIYLSEIMTSLSEFTVDNSVDGILFDNIYKLTPDSLDMLTDFIVTVPVILEKDNIKESMINLRHDLRKRTMNVDNYIKIDCINHNIDRLNSEYKYNECNLSIDDSINIISVLNEISNLKSQYITEMNFSNTIKLALNNLKRDVSKLSYKEKSISNSIDTAASNVANSIEKAMMNDRREAVIKGSIIPSASKCIKLAITTAATWAINPAIAVIGAIGAFACHKKLSDKERQLVLDDIEIELKMTERYIRQAEDKNDMKALRQLEIIQRNLQRQQQRIKLKQKIYFKGGNTDIENNDD